MGVLQLEIIIFIIFSLGLRVSSRRSLEETEILVTHMPHGDFEDLENTRHTPWLPRTGYHTGSPSLLQKVLRVQPLLHIFGHVPEGYGVTRHQDSHTCLSLCLTFHL